MDEIKIFVKNIKKQEQEILIETIRIFIQDKGMEFGIEKCAMIVMKKEGYGK